jgi:hypothetical protein
MNKLLQMLCVIAIFSCSSTKEESITQKISQLPSIFVKVGDNIIPDGANIEITQDEYVYIHYSGIDYLQYCGGDKIINDLYIIPIVTVNDIRIEGIKSPDEIPPFMLGFDKVYDSPSHTKKYIIKVQICHPQKDRGSIIFKELITVTAIK